MLIAVGAAILQDSRSSRRSVRALPRLEAAGQGPAGTQRQRDGRGQREAGAGGAVAALRQRSGPRLARGRRGADDRRVRPGVPELRLEEVREELVQFVGRFGFGGNRVHVLFFSPAGSAEEKSPWVESFSASR